MFSLCVWYTDDYEYYATVIVFMSLLSIFTDVYQIRKQESRLRNMVQKLDIVKVLRNGKEEEVFSDSVTVILSDVNKFLACPWRYPIDSSSRMHFTMRRCVNEWHSHRERSYVDRRIRTRNEGILRIFNFLNF